MEIERRDYGRRGNKRGSRRTASVHLNSPTNKRVSEVVMRRVLLMREVRKVSAVTLEDAIMTNELRSL
jgi:hypothetical protein